MPRTILLVRLALLPSIVGLIAAEAGADPIFTHATGTGASAFGILGDPAAASTAGPVVASPGALFWIEVQSSGPGARPAVVGSGITSTSVASDAGGAAPTQEASSAVAGPASPAAPSVDGAAASSPVGIQLAEQGDVARPGFRADHDPGAGRSPSSSPTSPIGQGSGSASSYAGATSSPANPQVTRAIIGATSPAALGQGPATPASSGVVTSITGATGASTSGAGATASPGAGLPTSLSTSGGVAASPGFVAAGPANPGQAPTLNGSAVSTTPDSATGSLTTTGAAMLAAAGIGAPASSTAVTGTGATASSASGGGSPQTTATAGPTATAASTAGVPIASSPSATPIATSQQLAAAIGSPANNLAADPVATASAIAALPLPQTQVSLIAYIPPEAFAVAGGGASTSGAPAQNLPEPGGLALFALVVLGSASRMVGRRLGRGGRAPAAAPQRRDA